MKGNEPPNAIVVTVTKQRGQSWPKQVVCFLVGLIGLLLATGCATTVYESSADVNKPPQMSFPEARQALLQTLQQGKEFNFARHPKAIQLTSVGFSFTTELDGKDYAHAIRFSDLKHLAVEENNPIQKSHLIKSRASGETFVLFWDAEDDAKRFVDAVSALNHYTSSRSLTTDTSSFAEFQEKAKTRRALPAKPPLPDQVQRFKVLAEDAFQNKNFEQALGYYQQGLAIEPLWPDGQLNAALFCGELQLYSQAAIHMKRYLALCPDAKDAKKCRNQMFIWEEKIK